MLKSEVSMPAMRYFIFIVVVALFSDSYLSADTFTHSSSGRTFNGYTVQKKKGDKTQVRVQGKAPQYIDLSDYEISYNYLGRKNKVFVFSIKDGIDFICETQAFEKELKIAAAQGPYLILIEIDTPGGRVDLTKRLCAAITEVDNCHTVAYIKGGKFGGAFSAGAIISLACDSIYMADDTSIGAATPIVISSSGIKDVNATYGPIVAEKFSSALRAYCSSLAERKGRPGILAEAMIEKDIEVLEVADGNDHIFITPKNKKSDQQIVHTWSKKGSLLTLTAQKAVNCGIAEAIADSRAKLLKSLDVTRAKTVTVTKTSTARAAFEKNQGKFKELLLSIDSYVKQVNALLENQDSQCIGLLKKLIKTYKKAISITEKHSDLASYKTNLSKGLNSAKAAYKKIASKR